MKKCIVCKHETESDTATCPKCGEASFGLPYALPEAVLSAADFDEAIEELSHPFAAPRKGKRTK